MKKFYIYLTILFTYIFISTNVLAENKVAYIDLDFILSNINAGKVSFEKLKKNEDKKLQELKTQEQNLKEEENKIIASKNILSEEKLNINIKNFQKKLKNFKKLKSDEINNLKEIRNKEVVNLLNLINPYIEKYMSENSVKLIYKTYSIIK